jgi:hypothetical protein
MQVTGCDEAGAGDYTSVVGWVNAVRECPSAELQRPAMVCMLTNAAAGPITHACT